jgi:hypothetical protein
MQDGSSSPGRVTRGWRAQVSSKGRYDMQEPIALPVAFSPSVPSGPQMPPVLVFGGSQDEDSGEAKPSPVQTILAESTFDAVSALSVLSSNPFATDLAPLVSQTVAVLSYMAMELGVIFRVRIRIDRARLTLDAEKFRRALNALLVHLLSVSNPQAFMTIQLESQTLDDRPGYAVSLSSNHSVIGQDVGPESEEFWIGRPEISVCRRIIEEQRGRLTAERTGDGTLTYTLWLPA